MAAEAGVVMRMQAWRTWLMLPRFLSTRPEYLILKHVPYHHAPELMRMPDEVDDGVADVDKAMLSLLGADGLKDNRNDATGRDVMPFAGKVSRI
jgi:hypothetical protein